MLIISTADLKRGVTYLIQEKADGIPSRTDKDHDDQVPTPPIRSEPDSEGSSEKWNKEEKPPIAH
jgi:hypothetical protein